MANAANTAWKLTDLENASLWTADSSHLPDNLNQQVNIAFEMIERPRDDQNNWLNWGMRGRNIVGQGIDVYDKDVWALSSAVNSRKLMKFWAGEDWFIYCFGQECTITRDQLLPNLATYRFSLMCPDPFWYYSNSPAGSGSGKDWVVPNAAINESGGVKGNWHNVSNGTATIDVALTGSGANEGTSYVEPCFICIGRDASTSITALKIVDEEKREMNVTFGATLDNPDVFIIMPWRRKSYEGFMMQDAAVIKLDNVGGDGVTEPSGTDTVTAGTWVMDIWNTIRLYYWCNNISGGTTSFAATDDDYPNQIRSYPRALDGTTTTFTLTTTGTIGSAVDDFYVYAQWCERRL